MLSRDPLAPSNGNLGRTFSDAPRSLLDVARHVGGSVATEATSRSPSVLLTFVDDNHQASNVEKGLALSPAHDPSVIRSNLHSLTRCRLEAAKECASTCLVGLRISDKASNPDTELSGNLQIQEHVGKASRARVVFADDLERT